MFLFSRRSVLTGLALMASLSSPLFASAQSVYVAGSTNEFGTVDVTTGVFTAIGTGTTFNGAAVTLSGLAFLPAPSGTLGTLYGIDAMTPTLYSIDPTTGTLTNAVALTGLTGAAAGLASSLNGTLYLADYNGVTNSVLDALDPVTGVLTSIGNLGNQSSASLAFVGNTLYQTDNTPTSNDPTGVATDVLDVVNTTTGVATPIGSGTGAQFIFGFANVNGTLYGLDGNLGIETIDPTTGFATPVGTYTLPNGDTVFAATFPIAQASVPEPSTLTLLIGMGVTGAGFCARRKRARNQA